MKGAWSGARAASPLGLDLPSALTSTPRSVSHWDLAAAAAKQIAKAGSRISRAQDAEDMSIMWAAPQDLEDALYRAAYFSAVAARVEGKKTLAVYAARYLAEGKARANVPGRDTSAEKIADVLQSARSNIRDTTIRSILLQAEDVERQQITRDRAADTSLTSRFVDPLVATIDTFRDPRKWPWYAWAAGAGIVLLFASAYLIGTSKGRGRLVQGVQAGRKLRARAKQEAEKVGAQARKARNVLRSTYRAATR